ncbi:hypothetical protein HMN09_01007600 [Mycena chlorophos]|uniref:Uncharacterized protein n=1 Tax=Mycena chlorophos TaxID=658473 RepID=A0A8H6SEA4_MYCCL|nr:hypothetical protein HMN09_01007600 [Mycena chlorophos]
MDALPPELTALIVDALPENRDCLAVCSLVGSQFKELCQRRIFANIRLCCGPGKRGGFISCVAAASHLDAFPHLAAYVKEIQLFLPEPDTPESELEVLGSILRRLNNIHDAQLLYGTWNRLSDPLREAVLHLLESVWRAPKQNQTVLFGVAHVPPELIHRSLWRASSLSLDLLPDLFPTDQLPAATEIPHLRSLAIRSSGGVYPIVLASPRCLRVLRSLCIQEKANVMPLALDLLGFCSSLEQLAIVYEGALTLRNPPNRLPPQLHLHHLEIYLRAVKVSSISSSWIVPEILSNLIGQLTMPVLRTLRVQLDIRTWSYREPTYDPPPSMQALDRVFEGLLHEGVVIDLVAVYCETYNYSAAKEMLLRLGNHVDAFISAMRRGLATSVEKGLKLDARGSQRNL